jgi:hypothetical protein
LTTDASAAEADGREPGSDAPSGFVGRGGWHLVAFLAALALILVMSIDWYTDERGEELRRIESGPTSAQIGDDRQEEAANAAEAREKTAWQADALIDRLIVLACLIAFVGAVAAAFMRSAGRKPEPPWHPSAIATVAGVTATLLILYRMFQPPGLNEAAVVKAGAPLGLVAVGLLTIGSRLAVLGERDELAGDGPAARAPADEGDGETQREETPSEPRVGLLSRLMQRRERGGEAAGAAAAAPAGAETEAEEAGGFEFDFPTAPPEAEDRAEPAPVEEPAALEEPEAEPVEEPEALEEEPEAEPLWDQPAAEEAVAEAAAAEAAPPVDERAVGAENPEEAPEWAPPDPATAEEPSPDDLAPPEPEEPLEEAIEDEPAEPEHLPGDVAAVDEPPDPEDEDEEDLAEVEDEPAEDDPVADPPVEEPPVADPPVEEPPVEDPPVEDPPVDAPEEPLPLGEEIEFEYDPDSPGGNPGPPPPDPDAPPPDPDER